MTWRSSAKCRHRTDGIGGSHPQLLAGQPGAFDTGANLGEGDVPGGGRVVGKRGEATVVAGAQPIDGDVAGGRKDAIAYLCRCLHMGIDGVDYSDEHPGVTGQVFGDDAENAVGLGLAGELEVEVACFEPE